MSDFRTGVLAMIAACTIWGLSPFFYRALAHVPTLEVLAHRALWSLVFFAGLLVLQGRLGAVRAAFADRGQARLIVLAMANVSVNWFLFIYATSSGRVTESSLGYFIYPLVAVVLGFAVYGERLSRAQVLAVALAGLAVLILSLGLGAPPWISLALAATFAFYGAIKKELPLGPVISVTCEVLVFLPFALVVLAWRHGSGQGTFGQSGPDTALLVLSGIITALPLILFAAAARRVDMSTVGILHYINPSLQFLCAALIFGEPQTIWHLVAFPMIWVALAVYSIAMLRQETARRAVMATSGVSATVRKPRNDGSAKP